MLPREWEDLFFDVMAGSATAEAYKKKAHDLLCRMAKAYRQGKRASLLELLEILEQSRPWCSNEPLRGEYERAACYGVLYCALLGIDELSFEESYALSEEVRTILAEKIARQQSGQVPRRELDLRLFLLTVLSELKWKGPSHYRNRICSPEELMDEVSQTLTEVSALQNPVPKGVKTLISQTAVNSLLIMRRWGLNNYSDVTRHVSCWLDFSPTDLATSRALTHSGAKYQLGLLFLEPSTSDTTGLQELADRLLRTAHAEYSGQELEEYLAAISKELSWIKRARAFEVI